MGVGGGPGRRRGVAERGEWPAGGGRHDASAAAVLDMRRGAVAVALAVLMLLPALCRSQDGDLDGLLLLSAATTGAQDVSSKGLQVYRVPISYPLRRLGDKPWGLRLTFPISFGTYELSAATDIGDVVESIQSVAVIPGIEFLVPVGETWVLKPFGEVGIGDDSRTGETHLLYAAGIRARGDYEASPLQLMVGAAFKYRNAATTDVVKNWYSTVEGGVDAQVPLGFSLGSREARGGGYAILRHFSDLELELVTEGPFDVSWNYEVGLSFATEPALRIWKIKLPWIGLGYRFGDRIEGIRLNFAFPF